MSDAKITVYGAPWCPDCTRAKQFLGEQRVRYDWVDIDQNEEARAYVQQVNDGKQIIPTIIFEDGSLLVEPSNAELAAKLGIQPKARRNFYDLIVVGGGPAGLSTALYAAREGIETLVIESSAIGGQAGVTERIDNYLGFPEGVEGARLADDMRGSCRAIWRRDAASAVGSGISRGWRVSYSDNGVRRRVRGDGAAACRGDSLSQAECAR